MKYSILSKCISLILLFFLSANVPVKSKNSESNNDQPVPVDSVDLEKYAGVWYEIARLPNRFQRKCSYNTTATYKLRHDGQIDVINRCIKNDGSFIEAKGIAKVVDTESNARLKVSFVKLLGFSLFWGDYWIIGLDLDYNYAVVGTPSRNYGWILSRQSRLSSDEMNKVFAILRNQGYNPDNFIMTEHKPDK
jgi:apolipoprotein D and lipocalin family protein